MIYLAAPYSHEDPDATEQRLAKFCMVDAKYVEQGIHTVSPLFKCLLFKYCKVRSDWKFWKEYSIQLMKKCDKLVVITLDGWKESEGVQDEIKLANEFGIDVEYVNL